MEICIQNESTLDKKTVQKMRQEDPYGWKLAYINIQ